MDPSGRRPGPAIRDRPDLHQLPDGDEGDERVRATYGPNYTRLVEIKRAYDPGNLFRSNRNIVA